MEERLFSRILANKIIFSNYHFLNRDWNRFFFLHIQIFFPLLHFFIRFFSILKHESLENAPEKKKFNFKKKKSSLCTRKKIYNKKNHLGEKKIRDRWRYINFFFEIFSYSKVSIYWRKLTIVYIIVSLQKGSWSRALDKSKSKRKQFPSLSLFFFLSSLPPSLSLYFQLFLSYVFLLELKMGKFS